MPACVQSVQVSQPSWTWGGTQVLVCQGRRRRSLRQHLHLHLHHQPPLSHQILPQPRPPKLTRIVAPESPSRTLLLRAQRLARITAKKKAAESRKLLTEHQQAYEVAGRLFDAKLKRIETESHAKNPSRKFSAARAAARIDKATAELSEARYTLLGAVLLACEADGEVLLAQSACKDAKIARLRRQLRVAQRTRRKRRGWSTTRVRFSL